MKTDPINPSHYKSHQSRVECILVSEKMDFCLGNAFKYLYRCTDKGYTLNDLKKAQWYLEHALDLRINYWFKWFNENENFDARFDGSEEVQTILAYEHRFNGWMAQALERIYTASVQKRGLLALEQASDCVANMIKIRESQEGGG